MPGERKGAEHTQSASSLVEHFAFHSEMNHRKVKPLSAGSYSQSTDSECAREGKTLESCMEHECNILRHNDEGSVGPKAMMETDSIMAVFLFFDFLVKLKQARIVWEENLT